MLDEAERRNLMERFPLSVDELDHLTKVFDAYDSNRNETNGCQSLAACFPLSSQRDIVESLEKNTLPELSQIFARELEAAYVVGYSATDKLYKLAQFLEAAVLLMGRRGPLRDDKLFWSLVDDGQARNEARVPCTRLASLVYRLLLGLFSIDSAAIADFHDVDSSHRTIERWSKSMQSMNEGGESGLISCHEWENWVQSIAPETTRLLALIFDVIFVGTLGRLVSGVPAKTSAGQLPFEFVTDCNQSPERVCAESISGIKSSFWSAPTEGVPLQLSLMGLGGTWLQENRRLYSSEENGLSFTALSQALQGFAGPTLILIQTTKGATFGYYSEVAWKSGPCWHSVSQDSVSTAYSRSTPESFLFRLFPSWSVYRWHGDDSSFTIADAPWNRATKSPVFHQYLYAPLSHRKGVRLEGLAVGGFAEDAPRLHITTSLEDCRACFMDRTFQSGPLLEDDESIFFDVDVLEVWAVRSDHFGEDLAAGRLNASVRESTRHHLAQVDRKQFLDDFVSGAYMNQVYKHRGLIRGEGSFNGDEDEPRDHYIHQSCPKSPKLGSTP